MDLNIQKENKFCFVDEGKGKILLLIHGLFGELSNWSSVIWFFSKKYRVIIPLMPIYEMSLQESNLESLTNFLTEFINFKKLSSFSIIGNSLGGHIGLIYTLKNSQKVENLILTGSSGLFENTMGGSFPRRGSYEYIKERVAYTFYDPKKATKNLVNEIFKITRSIPKCQRVVSIARSAQRNNMAHILSEISSPTLLIWGLNDTITPPYVAHEFNSLIPNSCLKFIDKCCHVPMMEHPEKFNALLEEFLVRETERISCR